jgi:hypothetical protein
MTVSWRRSALGAEAVVGTDARDGGTSASFVPHEPQKLEPGGLSCRQALHVIDCGAPHWWQNRLSAGRTAPQLRQAKLKEVP